MVKIIDRIKERYCHRSLYKMTIPELEKLQKKQVENGWIQAVNAIIAVIFGQCFFWYEYQHMGIIITLAGVFIGIGSLFTSNYVEQIDEAIFLIESTKEE